MEASCPAGVDAFKLGGVCVLRLTGILRSAGRPMYISGATARRRKSACTRTRRRDGVWGPAREREDDHFGYGYFGVEPTS